MKEPTENESDNKAIDSIEIIPETDEIIDETETEINPALDIRSEKFDPLLALYSSDVKIPFPDAKIFDNVSKFESRIQIAGGSFSKKLKSKILPKPSLIPKVEEPIKRNWLEHQLPVPTTRFNRVCTKNILHRMNEGYNDGPLTLLKQFREEGKRVKIYTRKEKGIRGFITGFIEAYDKYLNIAIKDVFEKWTRRKYKFSPDTQCYGTPQDMSKQLKNMGLIIPEITAKSLNRKYVECTRYVPQLMIRGEQVVLITLDNEVK